MLEWEPVVASVLTMPEVTNMATFLVPVNSLYSSPPVYSEFVVITTAGS